MPNNYCRFIFVFFVNNIKVATKEVGKFKFTTKKVFTFILFLFLCAFNISLDASSVPNYVIPGGESIGLQLDTGVHIVGKYEVQTRNGKIAPWQSSDIQNGDKIITLDHKPVKKNQDIIEILQQKKNGDIVNIQLLRRQTTVYTTIKVIENQNKVNSIGLYIRDRILGVGTLTFINPKTNQFGALGHGVMDNNLDLSNLSGFITRSRIDKITRAEPGAPGEKLASVSSSTIGTINKNKDIGVFGRINAHEINKQLMRVGKARDVRLGKAEMWTVIENEKVEKFEIEIIETKRQTSSNIKGIKIKVTDQRLIEKTGGIIQGMSGSPIIQDHKIVGAISHVIVDNPLVGYGVYVEWMLTETL